MHKFFKRNKKLFIILLVLVGVLILGKILIIGFKYSPVLFQLAFDKDVSLKKSNNNINILLLGIGGGKHDGPNLSDTIIFASINQTNNKITLVSIPRDFWVPDLDAKINTAYATGEEKRKGGGLLLSKAVVSKIVGQSIDYALRVDFAGFVKAVDMVEGLDIEVENTLDDYIYPVEGKENAPCGHTEEEIASFSATLATASATVSAEEETALFFPCRYQYIHFSKGQNHMNGIEALQFVRSRHALGAEGTDFARSIRQQKVIKAFKDKVFSIGTLLNPAKVLGLYSILESSIDTDIKQEEFDDFIRLAQELKTADIKSTVLDFGDLSTGREGLLVNPTPSKDYNFAWVLTPRIGAGNFLEIQEYVNCEIKTGNCKVSSIPN